MCKIIKDSILKEHEIRKDSVAFPAEEQEEIAAKQGPLDDPGETEPNEVKPQRRNKNSWIQ